MSSTCKILLIFFPGLLWKPTIKFSKLQSWHGNGKGAEPHCSSSINRRCKIPFQTSGFCSFSMPKYSSTHLLSGCISASRSAELWDHGHLQRFLQAREHPQKHVSMLPDCSLVSLTKTVSEATWWRGGGWGMVLGSSSATDVLAKDLIPV